MHAPSRPSAALPAEPHPCHRPCSSLRRLTRHVTLSPASKQPRCSAAQQRAPLHARILQRTAAASRLPAPSWPSCSPPSSRAPNAANLAAEAATSSRPEAAAYQRSYGDGAQHAAPAPQPLQLPQYDPSSCAQLDLVVAGGGPAGLAVAERVSAAGYKVSLEAGNKRCPSGIGAGGCGMPIVTPMHPDR